MPITIGNTLSDATPDFPFRIMWVKIPLVTSSASYPYGMPVFGYVSKMLDDQI